jgi:cellulose synthase operon protein B
MRHKIITFMILLGLLLTHPLAASADTRGQTHVYAPFPQIEVGENQATVTFEDLDFRETTLVSPFDITRVFFSVPANWKLREGGSLRLDYEVTLTGADVELIGSEQNPYGGSMVVSFNDQVVGTIALSDLGAQTMEFQIPAEALAAVRQDGRHQLTITLGAQFSCIYDIRAVVVIKPTSTLNLLFDVTSPVLDLSRLPAPFHLRDSLVPDRTLVVVPDEPDALELKAGLNVMAGFGSIIGSEADFRLVTPADLTDEALGASNLIFVGMPSQFEQLGEIAFPLAVEDNTFASIPPESEADGVIQLAVSPWNESKAAMYVGGASTDAVLKAAQAVSSGRILIYQDPALAYVANVQLLADTLPAVTDFTLESLGYENETLSGIGSDSFQYSFNVSKEQVNSPDAFIDLKYFHSGLLDYNASSFSLELNGELISSVSFARESEQLTALQIKIPTGILRFGENRLSISSRLLATTSCDSTGFSDPWLTISNQTALHLPVGPADNGNGFALPDLKFYPDLFTTQSDLGDVAFVLPRADTAAWDIAGRLAYNLGSAANSSISNLDAAFAEDVPQEILAQNSLVVIGRSSTVPLLAEINDQLPAPFDFATDTASERNMQIVYRVPAGMSVGYLQLLPSPYNQEKSILVLAGNTDEGVTLAGNSLLQPDLSSQLTGVFAVTNGTQVATGSGSSPVSIVGTMVPPSDAEVVINTPVPVSADVPPVGQPPGWLFPVLIASGVAIVLIILLAIVSAVSRRRAEEAALTTSRTNGNRNGHS